MIDVTVAAVLAFWLLVFGILCGWFLGQTSMAITRLKLRKPSPSLEKILLKKIILDFWRMVLFSFFWPVTIPISSLFRKTL